MKPGWPQTAMAIRGVVFHFGFDEKGRLVVFARKRRLAARAKPATVSQFDWDRAIAIAGETLRSCRDNPAFHAEPNHKASYRNHINGKK